MTLYSGLSKDGDLQLCHSKLNEKTSDFSVVAEIWHFLQNLTTFPQTDGEGEKLETDIIIVYSFLLVYSALQKIVNWGHSFTQLFVYENGNFGENGGNAGVAWYLFEKFWPSKF